jgi:hypothetical protein
MDHMPLSLTDKQAGGGTDAAGRPGRFYAQCRGYFH